jgi:hypothetical protein
LIILLGYFVLILVSISWIVFEWKPANFQQELPNTTIHNPILTKTESHNDFFMSPEKGLSISIIFGMLGSTIHGLCSLVAWHSHNKLKRSYIWWYITKPLLGASFAIIIYIFVQPIILKGLLFDYNIFINEYFIAVISAFVGLLSNNLPNKIRDISDYLFGIQRNTSSYHQETSLFKIIILIAGLVLGSVLAYYIFHEYSIPNYWKVAITTFILLLPFSFFLQASLHMKSLKDEIASNIQYQ